MVGRITQWDLGIDWKSAEEWKLIKIFTTLSTPHIPTGWYHNLSIGTVSYLLQHGEKSANLILLYATKTQTRVWLHRNN